MDSFNWGIFIPMGGVLLIAFGFFAWMKYDEWIEKKGNKHSSK
ncbi:MULTISPECIES: hypothetical protein [Parabacteroides]|nr:hypothetical protein [Parabacteroides provencensis]